MPRLPRRISVRPRTQPGPGFLVAVNARQPRTQTAVRLPGRPQWLPQSCPSRPGALSVPTLCDVAQLSPFSDSWPPLPRSCANPNVFKIPFLNTTFSPPFLSPRKTLPQPPGGPDTPPKRSLGAATRVPAGLQDNQRSIPAAARRALRNPIDKG